MEHREPPRIGAGDCRLDSVAPDPPGRFRVRRIESTGSNRPRNHRRDGVRATVLTVGLGVVAAVGLLGIQALVRWLQVQPFYQIPFRNIRLDTELPPWYRGGVDDFLDRVRRYAREEETLPVLRLEPHRIERAFGHHPLVDRVVRVSYPPRGVRVAMRFRQPVALLLISATEQYLLDETATILPREEVALDRLEQHGPVITIWARGLAGPFDSQPGATWKPNPGVMDVDERNERIPAAAKLAGFLVRKIRSLGSAPAPALQILEIIVTDPPGERRGLFLWNREETSILWGAAPGEEGPGDLNAEAKWAALCDWSERPHERRLRPGDYWEFTSEGRLRPVRTRRAPGPTPNQAPAAGKVAAGSG
jgi:hypothetical protein